jgi:DNA-binding CsgD family transcriptional regulator
MPQGESSEARVHQSAGSLPPAEDRPLLGRTSELQLLGNLIDGANDEQGAALVVRGEAGIGKSALVAAASRQARARGLLILSTTGVQSETHVPFAGLHQLLRPILGSVTELPGPQRDALLAAFGMISAPAPDLFLIGLAALELLAAASHTPVVAIAEDAHWLDSSTVEVLTFIARRIGSDPIILLITTRDGTDNAIAKAGLPELLLEALDEVAASQLLDRQSPQLAPLIRQRLLEGAAGNPLALVELPVALTEAQRDGEALLPDWLPLTVRLEQAFGGRIAQLPRATRTLLLVACADEAGVLDEILRAAAFLEEASSTMEALGLAVDARLVEIHGLNLRFCHPLIRSALLQIASVVERHAVHDALARVLAGQPDRVVWHQAAAATGPDEEIASELERAATQAQYRGAVAVAVTALERSAQLTTEPALRGERLVRAAELALELSNELGVRILHSVAPADLEPRERTRLLWFTEVFGEEGAWSGAARVASFVAIARQAQLEGNVGLALSSLMLIAYRCWWANPDERTRKLIIDATERTPAPEDHPLRLTILALAAPVERGASVLDHISRLSADGGRSPATGIDFESAQLLGTSASALGDFVAASQLLEAGIVGLRQQGRLGLLAQVLVTQAWTYCHLGAWHMAIPAAEEASLLAQETGQTMWTTAAHLIQAQLAGLHGKYTLAEALSSEAEQTLLPRGANPQLALVQIARGLAALSAGSYATAYEQLQRIFDPADTAYHMYVRCWVISELVEAAVHSGHREDARALVADLESVAEQARFPYLQAGLSYARPLLAEDNAAEALYVASQRSNLSQWPFLRARLLLAYGSWLRRQRRSSDSRAPLRAAREAFDALGALPWGEQARRELRASGETSRPRTPDARDQLSPQELQIAQMASDGLSNREIGQRLYISHRTVGFHLYHIFPKLGITARSELRSALEGSPTAREWSPTSSEN